MPLHARIRTTLTLALMFCAGIMSAANAGLVINEIDADTASTDVLEFIELMGDANMSLDGYSVVLFNGSDDLSYLAWDLDGFSTDANGFFLLGNTGLSPSPTLDIGASNVVQNGADAVALYQDDAVNFPNDTAMTMTNLIDAIVYGTNDPDDAALLTGLGQSVQYNEDELGDKDTDSIGRIPNGMSGSFQVLDTPTPGALNVVPEPAAAMLAVFGCIAMMLYRRR